MFVEEFIASRLASATNRKSFSRVIIRLAIASVALGISVMIVSSSMINGFKKEISLKIFDFWGHIHVTDVYGVSPDEASPIDYDAALIDSLLDVDRIYYEAPISIFGRELDQTRNKRTKGGIKYAYRYIQNPGILSTKEDMEGMVFKGIAEDFPEDFFKKYMVAGRVIDRSAGADARELVVSRMTATRMQLESGDQVLVHFIKEDRPQRKRFTVVGIYKTGLAEYDKRVAFLHLSHLQDALDWDVGQVSGIEVVLDDLDDIEIMDAFVDQQILPPHLYTRSIRQKAASIFDWLDLQSINEVLILGLMLAVCVINMITSLLILILERTQMIGVLKALGANNWQVRKIFIRQAARILIVGLVIGNGLGLLLCFLQKQFKFITLREEDYYLAVAPIDINVPVLLFINIGTLVVTVLFLILPSYFISRISPTKAIRFS